MANDITASFKTARAREMQEVFYKTNVAMKIADTSFKSDLKDGKILTRPYRSTRTAQLYNGSSIDLDDITDTAETLTVDKKFVTGFKLNEFDDIQSAYNSAMLYGKDDGEALSNMIDAYVLGEVVNSASYVDAGDVGGTAGQGISLSTTTVFKAISAATKKMRKLNVSSSNLYAVVSPEFADILTQYVESRETPMGDRVGENGYIGTYGGYKFYVSNQLASSAVLGLATNPTANDTVVIAGVTFTFVSSIGTAAGNVLIGANADATRANLATLINAPSTTTSTGVKLSDANARLFATRVSATNDDTANTLTVIAKGLGVLDVSETLTAAGDVWTTTSQLQRALFGVYGNPVLVIQREPKIKVTPIYNDLADSYLNGVLFGTKTFADNAKQMVDVRIDCSGYNA